MAGRVELELLHHLRVEFTQLCRRTALCETETDLAQFVDDAHRCIQALCDRGHRLDRAAYRGADERVEAPLLGGPVGQAAGLRSPGVGQVDVARSGVSVLRVPHS